MLRLYLDQRDLIDLAEGDPEDASDVLRLVEDRRVQVVLSFNHILETWKYGNASGRDRVARLADSLRPSWILFRPELFQAEIAASFLKFVGHQVATEWLPSSVSGYFKTEAANPRQHIFVPFRPSSFESHFPRADSLTAPKQSFRAYLTVLEEEHATASALVQLHETYSAQSPEWKTTLSAPGDQAALIQSYFDLAWTGVPIPAAVRSQFLESADRRACPALSVYFEIRQAILKDRTAHSAPSEMVDVAHVVALPYCDAFSTDKRIWDYLRRCRISREMFSESQVGKMTPFKKLGHALTWIRELPIQRSAG